MPPRGKEGFLLSDCPPDSPTPHGGRLRTDDTRPRVGRDVRFLLYREHPSRFYEREGCFLATYTENFGLHQWIPEDDFLRSDFNADFAKIDQALAAAATEADLTELRTRVNGKCELLTGSFLGNGAETRSINIGDRPLALAICSEQNMFATVLMRGGDPMGPLSLTTTGFTTGTGGNVPQNVSGVGYQFFALV